MRQRNGRPGSMFLAKCVLFLCFTLLLQPLSGCANDSTSPTTATPTTAGSTTLGSAVAATTALSAATTPTAPTSPTTQAPAVSLPQPSRPSETTVATTPATSSASIAPTATPSPSPTPKPTPKPTLSPTPKPTPKPLPYYLYCELGSYTLQVYRMDAKGNYTIPVRRIRTAIGRGSMTPRGKFTLGSRERWHTFGSSTYAQYAIKYASGLYLHSPLYSSKDIRTLQSWSYEAIGTKNTSGCLRMPTGDVYWIYRNCAAGTVIEIVSNSPRGLTPPALAPLVNGNEDPTDPLLG